MGISTSTYYYKARNKSNEDAEILKKIEKICEKLPRAGYHKITDILRKEIKINHKRVYRLMFENGLLCRKKPSKRRYTTNSKHGLRRYPNLVKGLSVSAPNQVVVGDVTAFDVCGRDYYLAILMDMHSRYILGFAVSQKNNTAVVKTALEMAKARRGSLEGCIHHTDSDVRYCSKKYTSLLKEYGMTISMCLGNAYENAFSESLNATVKREEIRINDYQDGQASYDSLKKYIQIYNEYRPHQSLAYQAPIQVEEKFSYLEQAQGKKIKKGKS